MDKAWLDSWKDYPYQNNIDFLSRLKNKVIAQGAFVFSEAEASKWTNDLITKAISKLKLDRRAILFERLIHKKTLAETGAVSGMSHQRIWQIEQEAYKEIQLLLMKVPNETLWEDRPLISSRCQHKSSIEIVLRDLPPSLTARLKENGYGQIDSLCAATPKQLMGIQGIGWNKLKQIEQAVLKFKKRNPSSFDNSHMDTRLNGMWGR